MITYKGIHHTALVTSNMDETIRFWRDLLCMRLVTGVGGKGYRQYFFQVSESSFITFFEWDGVETVEEKEAGRAVKGPIIFDHICIEVQDSEHLWRLKDRLEEAGVWVTEVIDNAFIHSIFTSDPNNISIEFCYSVDKLNIVENPVITDSSPSDIVSEGSEPQIDKWPETKNPTPEEERKIYPGELQRLLNKKK